MSSLNALEKQLGFANRMRNILLFCLVVMLLAVAALSVALMSKDKEIVLIPSVIDEMNITASRVPDAYLLSLTHDMSNLLLNRHPHDTSYFKDNVLRMVHPRYHNAIVRQIEFDEDNNKFKSGTKVFRPIVLCRVRGDVIQSEAVGEVETYINGSRIAKERLVYRYVWEHEGFHVRVKDIRQLKYEESSCANQRGT